MRRGFRAAAAALALIFLLAAGASAATGASSVTSYTTVSSSGACQVTLVATLHLEQALEQLTFPLPLNASNVTLNGSRVRTQRSGDVRLINLSNTLGGFAGDYTINLQYSLSNVIHTGSKGVTLELPLLSGFAYPVQSMSFSITLPGEITAQPTFSSGYHQNNIEGDLEVSVSGATISGTCQTELKDHETLTMVLQVPEDMFPRAKAQTRSFQWVDTAMLLCAFAALAYWLIFLRTPPLRRQYRATPPEGYSAGQMGSILHLQGMDLTLTVLSWAQLGYVLIQPDRNGHVLLHKRMDMGNERSSLEQYCFRALFGKRQTVDTSGLRYAQLCQKAAALPAGIQELVHRRSGNLRLFRALAAGIGLLGGIWLGQALVSGGAFRYLLAIGLGALGAVSGWQIQSWGSLLFQWNRQKLPACAVCCAGWLLLGLLAGEFQTSLWVVAAELLAGLMAAFGGRRTDWGRQIAAQALGLRRYLQKVPKEDLRRLQTRDPEYYYSLAPYALALNADKAFAKRFGSQRLPGCPYLTTGFDRHMTALEWSRLLRRTAQEMDLRRRKMPMERLLGVIQGIVRP